MSENNNGSTHRPPQSTRLDLHADEDRQHGESNKAYEAYSAYRDLGPSARSIRKVAKSLGKSRTLLERWASKYRWVERAERFDDVVERAREIAGETKLREVWQREATQAEIRMQARIARTNKAAAKLLRYVNASDILDRLSVKELWSWVWLSQRQASLSETLFGRQC